MHRCIMVKWVYFPLCVCACVWYLMAMEMTVIIILTAPVPYQCITVCTSSSTWHTRDILSFVRLFVFVFLLVFLRGKVLWSRLIRKFFLVYQNIGSWCCFGFVFVFVSVLVVTCSAGDIFIGVFTLYLYLYLLMLKTRLQECCCVFCWWYIGLPQVWPTSLLRGIYLQ